MLSCRVRLRGHSNTECCVSPSPRVSLSMASVWTRLSVLQAWDLNLSLQWYMSNGASSTWGFLYTHRNGLRAIPFPFFPLGSLKMLLDEFALLQHLYPGTHTCRFSPALLTLVSDESTNTPQHRDTTKKFQQICRVFYVWLETYSNRPRFPLWPSPDFSALQFVQRPRGSEEFLFTRSLLVYNHPCP